MIRCPFNNFGKCNNECPFAEDDATRCGLQRGLAVIEGVVRGIHSCELASKNATTTTNQLVGSIAQSVSALVVSVGKMSQPAPAQPEQPRLQLEDEETPAPMFAEDWVKAHGADWFVGKLTNDVWTAFVIDCDDGKAVKRTHLGLGKKSGEIPPEGRPVTQRTLTAIVRNFNPDFTLARTTKSVYAPRKFVRIRIDGGAE